MSSPNWGGARAGAGTPQRRIHLNLPTARVLRELVRLYNAATPEGEWTAHNLVVQLIYDEALRLGAFDRDNIEQWKALERGEAETTEPHED